MFRERINQALLFFLVCFIATAFPKPSFGDEKAFNKEEMSFKNFITCELTRTNAINHFKGKKFKITMIDLFDIQFESDIKIVTGAIECFVDDKYLTLYTAVGVTKLLETEQVSYYTIRDKDFPILASELIRYPYKDRCKWSQYWIDVD